MRCESVPSKTGTCETLCEVLGLMKRLCKIIAVLLDYYLLIFPSSLPAQKDVQGLLLRLGLLKEDVEHVEKLVQSERIILQSSKAFFPEKALKVTSDCVHDLCDFLRHLNFLLTQISGYRLPMLLQDKLISPEKTSIFVYLLLDAVRINIILSDLTTHSSEWDLQLFKLAVYIGLNAHVNLAETIVLSPKPIRGYLIEKYTFSSEDYCALLGGALDAERCHRNAAAFLVDIYRSRSPPPAAVALLDFIASVDNYVGAEFAVFYRVKSPVDYEYSCGKGTVYTDVTELVDMRETLLNALVCFLVNASQIVDTYCSAKVFPAEKSPESEFNQQFQSINNVFKAFLVDLYCVAVGKEVAFKVTFEDVVTAVRELAKVIDSYNCAIVKILLDQLAGNDQHRVHVLLAVNYFFMTAAVGQEYPLTKDPLSTLVYDTQVCFNDYGLFDFLAGSSRFSTGLNMFLLCLSHQREPKAELVHLEDVEMPIAEEELVNVLLSNITLLSKVFFTSRDTGLAFNDLELMIQCGQEMFDQVTVLSFRRASDFERHAESMGMNVRPNEVVL